MNLENSISDLLSHEPFEIDLNLKKKINTYSQTSNRTSS